jgi:uncharacterized Zn finger protein (UPF0148 family)
MCHTTKLLLFQNPKGHFYCYWCEKYIRANKKSATRHQERNKKHVLHAESVRQQYGIIPITTTSHSTTSSDNNVIGATASPIVTTSSDTSDLKAAKRGRKTPPTDDATAALTRAYIQGAKIPGMLS